MPPVRPAAHTRAHACDQPEPVHSPLATRHSPLADELSLQFAVCSLHCTVPSGRGARAADLATRAREYSRRDVQAKVYSKFDGDPDSDSRHRLQSRLGVLGVLFLFLWGLGVDRDSSLYGTGIGIGIGIGSRGPWPVYMYVYDLPACQAEASSLEFRQSLRYICIRLPRADPIGWMQRKTRTLAETGSRLASGQ